MKIRTGDQQSLLNRYNTCICIIIIIQCACTVYVVFRTFSLLHLSPKHSLNFNRGGGGGRGRLMIVGRGGIIYQNRYQGEIPLNIQNPYNSPACMLLNDVIRFKDMQ